MGKAFALNAANWAQTHHHKARSDSWASLGTVQKQQIDVLYRLSLFIEVELLSGQSSHRKEDTGRRI